MPEKTYPPLSILVIEDNAGDFTLIKTYLAEHAHIEITRAEDFRHASQVLTSGKNFDAVLLDLTLPDSNGSKLIADIFSLCSGCPIIILTGNSNVQFSIDSLSLGIADYLLKDDINSQSLYKSIIYSLERQKNIKELEESEKKYSDLFHLSPQPMWVYEIDTLRFLDVNNAAASHYGYTREEFLAMTMKDLLPGDGLQVMEDNTAYSKNHTSVLRALSTHKTKSGKDNRSRHTQQSYIL